MPNHICNKLKIDDENTRKEVLSYMMENNTNYNEYMDFNKIIPMPDYIYQGNLGSKEEELYGAENCWYDWSINNWETKWNAYRSNITDDDRIEFYTAWLGVPRLMGLLSQKFPNAEFDYKYADENVGYNAGRCRFKAGSVLENTCAIPRSTEAYYLYRDCYGIPDYMRIRFDRNDNAKLVYYPIERIKEE